MEEKDRYIIDHFGEDIFDTKIEDYPSNQMICDLLNQQDKRIKELEEENLSLQEQSIRDNQNWIEETTQLKQQLHDLPKKIVEDIQENFDWKQWCEIIKYYDQQYISFNYVAFNDFLDSILKKYGDKQ